MFTGLVEDKGRVQSLSGAELTVVTGLAGECSPGDSLSVDGSCLTVTRALGDGLSFHCSAETLSRTVLSEYHRGVEVNLERPLKLADRFHGHFVTGHVDTAARVLRVSRSNGCMTAWISREKGSAGLIVEKGSISVSGISLTVASVASDRFSVAMIPETLKRTTAGNWRPGFRVNIEYDLIGRHVLQAVRAMKDEATLKEYLERRNS